MKRSQPFGRMWWLIILISIATMLNGCAAKAPKQQQGALVPISKIEPQETDGKTEIVVEGAEPILQFTSFQLTEPLRLVVDISDADVGKFSEKMSVNKGAILDITPTQIDNIARLEISLSQAVDSKLYQSSGKLIIELGKPTEEAKAAPEAAAQPVSQPAVTAEAAGEEKAPAAEKTEEPRNAARVVTAVKASAGKDQTKVVVTADGAMRPNTFMADGKRLVIDIPNTTSRVKPSVIPVRRGGLDKIRVGQHAAPDKKVRVVLDLSRPMEYTATPEGNKLVIVLTAASAKKAEQQPQEKAAPQEQEKTTAPEKEITQPREEPSPAPPSPPTAKKERVESMEPAAAPALPMLIGGGKFTGRKISLDLQDADLINVLRLFAEVANLNMILSPEVRGRVTVRMVNIPWDQAMDIILKMNGLGFSLDGTILRIGSQAALARESDEEMRAKDAKKKAEDLVTRIIPINYTTAGAIEGTIKKSLSPRGETVVDPRTNTLIVKDLALNVDEVVTLVKLLDKPIPQIMIEARIVEATLTFSRTLGVQWGGGYKADAGHGNATGFSFPNAIGVTGGPSMGATPSGSGNFFVNMPAPAGAGSGGGALGFTFGSLTKALNLDLILSAIESTGEGKVVSSPRVSALDNKEAKIEQGISIPFATSSAGGATNVQFIDAKLSLSVTPHATPDGKIFMKIQATKNAPDTGLLGASGQPSIRKNEATTEILVADGETAVIGGIIVIDRGQTINKVPFLSEIPLIGWLFKQKSASENKQELIIFITPRIVKQEVI